MFRYLYAILKIHKNFIKSGKDLLAQMSIINSLEESSRANTNTDELHKVASKFSMKTATEYNFSK